MSDKPLAGLVTLAAILTLCAVCVLGPAAIGAMATSLAGWFGGLEPWVIVGAAAGGTALGCALWRRHMRGQVRAKRSM